MTFQDAVRICLTQKYADFSGRARRSEFWFFVLFSAIVRAVANVLDAILHIGNARTGGPVATVAALALLIPSLAVAVRRLHDTGRSGWWVLLGLIPLVGIIILIVWWAQDSYADNKYGPNPKGYGQGYVPGYEQGYVGQGYPGQGYPTQGYPGQEYPTQGYPGQGYPGQQADPGRPSEPEQGSGQPHPAPPAPNPPPPGEGGDQEERPPWGSPPR